MSGKFPVHTNFTLGNEHTIEQWGNYPPIVISMNLMDIYNLAEDRDINPNDLAQEIFDLGMRTYKKELQKEIVRQYGKKEATREA